MKAPVVLRWPLPDIAESHLAACPACGTRSSLTLAMDLDDRSDAPSYMTCPQGHTWAEDSFPRRLAAELLDDILQVYPDLLGWLDDLREMQGDIEL